MPSTIFQGNRVSALKNSFRLGPSADNAEIVDLGNVDPRVTATDAKAGSIGINTTTAQIFKKIDDGSTTNWTELGAGAGGINYVDNPDAEAGTQGYERYEDGAVSTPVDGTGGSPNAAFQFVTTNTVGERIRGQQSFKIIKDANNRQGHGVSYDFSIDEGDQGRLLHIQGEIRVSSGYVNNEVQLFMYDVTNARLTALIHQNDGMIPAFNGVQSFTGSFFAADDSTDYRLIMHVTGTSATAYDVIFDTLRIGPAASLVAPVITPWESFTPTGTFTTNTTYSGFKRRIGTDLEINMLVSFSGAPNAATFEVIIPDGLTIDQNVVQLGTVNDQLGECTSLDSGIVQYVGVVRSTGSTTSVQPLFLTDTSTEETFNNITATAPFSFNSGDQISVRFKVPIAEWSAGAVVSSLQAQLQTLRVVATQTTATHTGNGIFQNIAYSETKDTHNSFDGTTFTAPFKGDFIIFAACSFGTNSTGTRAIRLSSGIQGNQFDGQSSNPSAPVLATVLSMDEGDTFTIQGFQNSGGNLAYASPSITGYVRILGYPDFTTFGVTKKVEFKAATSSNFNLSSGTTATWFNMVGNSVELSPGTWQLHGRIQMIDSGGSVITRIINRWSAANGGGVGSTPTDITVDAGVNQCFRAVRDNGSTSLQDIDAPPVPVRVTVTEPTDVFLNSFVDFSVAGGGFVNVHIYAERIV